MSLQAGTDSASPQHTPTRGKDVSRNGTRDFLRKDAQTPFSESFFSAGIHFVLETNSEPLLDNARENFRHLCEEQPLEKIHLRLWVDPAGRSEPLRPKPYFRGLGHLIFAGIDTQNSLLINLRKRSVIGRLTPAIAADRMFWKSVIFPVMFAALGASSGMTALHCACVAWKGSGLLIAGESGSGKSTLALALAQTGFDFLSDDRTLFSLRDGRLLAWTFTPYLKLRPEAAPYFPELGKLEAGEIPNGEKAIWIDPEEHFSISRVQCCEPRWILILDRQSAPEFALQDIAPREAAARLEEGIPQETARAMQRQRETIQALAERDRWVLRYGGDPRTIARAIRGFLAGRQETRTIHSAPSSTPSSHRDPSRRDPLRRFTATAHTLDVHVMGRKIRIETNSSTVFDLARQTFGGYQKTGAENVQFVWRIVSEADGLLKPPWPEMMAFSDQRLRYINFGQRSFLAVDLEAREAVGFVSEDLVKDEAGFNGIFLAALYYLTAGALGLSAISASCVSLAGRGLLLFGVPNSGKTTSSYLAGRHGLTFHADQATFLEFEGDSLRAWGDFWPAAFRVETAQFVPELKSLARPLHHRDMTFLCIDKEPLLGAGARSVVPAACVFLERGAADAPRLIPLAAGDFSDRLRDALPFKDDAVLEANRQVLLRALSRLPAYRLLYGQEPGVPAAFFRSVLTTHSQVEGLE